MPYIVELTRDTGEVEVLDPEPGTPNASWLKDWDGRDPIKFRDTSRYGKRYAPTRAARSAITRAKKVEPAWANAQIREVAK